MSVRPKQSVTARLQAPEDEASELAQLRQLVDDLRQAVRARRGDRPAPRPLPVRHRCLPHALHGAQAANESLFPEAPSAPACAAVSMARFPGPPSAYNALTFTEEARRRSTYWLASWLAQNSHL